MTFQKNNRYEHFAAEMSPVPGVSILTLNQMAFGEDYKASQHPLTKYQEDVEQFRHAAAQVIYMYVCVYTYVYI